MERHTFRVATLSLLTLLVAFAARAQSSQHITVRIPFEFVAAERVLPAGDYSLSSAASDQTVLIRNNGTQKAVFVMTYVTQTRDRQPVPKLVFHRYGDQYFLREVWGNGTTTGSLLRQPVLEQKIAKDLKKPPQEITIASLNPKARNH